MFKALNPGLYIYHCATAPVGMHIANGMYGLIYVQPKNPLPQVDHEYYVVQGDFYTEKPFGVKGLQPFSMQKAIDEHPSYVVFNGSSLSLVGENALKAKVGETIRLYMGNGGPNLVSSFHVIGAIFDKVYTEGGTKVGQENVQTTLIPAGGSAIVEFKMSVPGTSILVDHSIFRTFNKGALGMIKTEGPEDKSIYSGKEVDEVYLGDESVASAMKAKDKGTVNTTKAPELKLAKKADGKQVFEKSCAMCHQANGQGVEGVFPPLAKSDFLRKLANQKDRSDLIAILQNGKTGKITVNGKEYNGIMTPVSSINDGEMTAVLNYITNTWGNSAPKFAEDEVKAGREKAKAANHEKPADH